LVALGTCCAYVLDPGHRVSVLDDLRRNQRGNLIWICDIDPFGGHLPFLLDVCVVSDSYENDD
jgi:hypothetical protein